MNMRERRPRGEPFPVSLSFASLSPPLPLFPLFLLLSIPGKWVSLAESGEGEFETDHLCAPVRSHAHPFTVY